MFTSKHFLIASSALLSINLSASGQGNDLPNIIWITSEDNSTFLGCYGDKFATTPALDKFAGEGFLYTRAYANAPVCAPARNTIITGIYANSSGNQHMRSAYPKADAVKFYPHYLREKGYYTTNNSKEDYNIDRSQTGGIWNESGTGAHYRNREPGQPFFAVFNTTISHESSIHSPKAPEDLRHDPLKVPLPPYHPDTPEIRHDWAYYYDRIEEMDTWVGKILKELDESGEAENTIVFYYADHGGILARSKRYLYETGTHVPFILRIPEKYKNLWPDGLQPGSEVDRLVSFVDLAPTLLSIIGTPVPDYMQGNAFLGTQKTDDPEFVYMFRDRMDERYDMSRSVRSNKFRYIRNYMPYRIYGQPLEYLWRAPSIRSWEAACRAGNCNDIQNVFWNTKPVEELYDTENDPWEVNNLAGDPEYSDVLQRMREANRNWMLEIKDTGLIPEADLIERTQGVSSYEYLRNKDIDIENIMKAAELATEADRAKIDKIIALTRSGNSAIRYWGVSGLLMLGEHSRNAMPVLIKAIDDPSPNVSIVASEVLYLLGEKDKGRMGLIRALGSPNAFVRTHALNTIDCVEDNTDEMRSAVFKMITGEDELSNQEYDHRAARTLLVKWNLDPAEYGYGW
jgi:N-sulfoglucosamine sulfohydrolase